MVVRRVDGEAVAEALGEEILQERHNDLEQRREVSILLIYLFRIYLFHIYIYIYIYNNIYTYIYI